MKKIALFTIVSKNYLPYARVLLSSVAKVHPEYRLFLCLADEVDGFFQPAAEPFETVEAQAIGIPNLLDLTLRYDIMEFNTAVKPFMFEWVFSSTDCDLAIYLDPDIRVFSRLDKIEGLLEGGASVVLTPHICSPLEDGKTPNDYNMLQAGVFNLGFMAARKCSETRAYLQWWGRRLLTECYADFQRNLFTDQRWCDLAPCFLNDLAVLRDSGFNVAYWNLAQQKITRMEGGTWEANGRPLVFFHFSGISLDNPNEISKHQNRYSFIELPHLKPLFDDYRDRLKQANWEEARLWPYAYAYATPDVKIPPIIRRFYRESNSQPRPIEDGALLQFLQEVCNAPTEKIDQLGPYPVTALMFFIYKSRPDLQAAFPLTTAAGQQAFHTWFSVTVKTEYDLSEHFIPAPPDQPVGATPLPSPAQAPLPQLNVHHQGTHLYRFLKGLDRLVLHRIWRQLPKPYQRKTSEVFRSLLAYSLDQSRPSQTLTTPTPNDIPRPHTDKLSLPATIPQLMADRQISRLMHLIWANRVDLQQAFDISTAGGQDAFSVWFETAAKREYGVAPYIPSKPQDSETGATSAKQRPTGKPGANLIGYAHAELGMGEHVRMTAAALDSLQTPFSVINFDVGIASRQNAALDHGELTTKTDRIANIFHINADQMLLAYCNLGESVFSTKYNIGYWAWELAKCPDAWLPVMEMIDEIWAPSRFIQDAFSAKTSLPVQYMPLCVVLPEFRKLGKTHFGLPSDSFTFLYTFDSFSYFARKNPFDAVRAFHSAFPDRNSKVALVLKTMNGNEESDHWKTLLALIDHDPRISIFNRTMDRYELLALFEAADCFVSLHRSEGFGRGPAEAMYLGKPVIVTNYSGNTDFTLADNSLLVNYELAPVANGEYPFPEGQVWAQPDVAHAAWLMHKIWNDHALRDTIGKQAKNYIQTNYSQQAIGSIYTKRLRDLGFVN